LCPTKSPDSGIAVMSERMEMEKLCQEQTSGENMAGAVREKVDEGGDLLLVIIWAYPRWGGNRQRRIRTD